MLSTDDTIPLKTLPVQLQLVDCVRASNELHTNKLAEILAALKFNESDLFTLQSNKTMLAQAELIDAHAPLMPLKQKFTFALAPISLENAKEKNYFLLCLKSAANNQLRALPTAPTWLTSTNAKHLEDAENLSKFISLYAWLSFKFPTVFVDSEEIKPLRFAVSRYIERALLSQAGYRQTSREQNEIHTQPTTRIRRR